MTFNSSSGFQIGVLM